MVTMFKRMRIWNKGKLVEVKVGERDQDMNRR